MEQQHFHNINSRSNRADINLDNEIEECIILPPIKYNPETSYNNMPRTVLPHIQTIHEQNANYIQEQCQNEKSNILNQLHVSSIQQAQSAFKFSSWIETYKHYISSYRFYLSQLDNNIARDVTFEIQRLGGVVEDACNEHVTHIVFLPPTVTNIAAKSYVNTLKTGDHHPCVKTGTSNAPSRYLSPFHSTLNYKLQNSGHYDLQIPPINLYPSKPPGMLKPILNDNNQNYNDSNNWNKPHLLEPYMLPPPTQKMQLPPLRSPFQGHNSYSIPSLKLLSYDRPPLKRSDIHFFKYPFVLVEDAYGQYRPAVAAEYPPAKDRDEIPWPKLYQVPTTRCPFIKVSSRKKGHDKRRLDHSNNKLSQSRMLSSNRGLILPSINVNNSESIENSLMDPLMASRRFCNETKDPNFNESIRLSALPNSHLQFEQRAIIHDTLPPIPRTIRLKASAAPAPTNAKKPGYCENCKQKFADIEEHVQGRVHRDFATNDIHFTSLDSLLSRLIRRPNPQLMIMTTPSSSSPNHYLSRSTKEFSTENQLSSGQGIGTTYSYGYTKDLQL